MDDEPVRSQAARAAAELALVRVVHHYGDRPEFVVLGGLVPQLLCSAAGVAHAGTTDIDVQVDLEIAGGVVNTGRLEQALRNAEFVPDRERVWRWATVADGVRAVVKFELLVDLETEPRRLHRGRHRRLPTRLGLDGLRDWLALLIVPFLLPASLAWFAARERARHDAAADDATDHAAGSRHGRADEGE